jgi:hypothetical protein
LHSGPARNDTSFCCKNRIAEVDGLGVTAELSGPGPGPSARRGVGRGLGRPAGRRRPGLALVAPWHALVGAGPRPAGVVQWFELANLMIGVRVRVARRRPRRPGPGPGAAAAWARQPFRYGHRDVERGPGSSFTQYYYGCLYYQRHWHAQDQVLGPAQQVLAGLGIGAKDKF